MTSGGSALALFARTGVSLCVVLALMWLAARGLQKRGTGGLVRTRKSAPIEVLARQGLARNTQVAVIRTCGRTLVVGVTQSGLQVLADDGANLAVPQEEAVFPTSDTRSLPPGWKPVLDALRERTVRRT